MVSVGEVLDPLRGHTVPLFPDAQNMGSQLLLHPIGLPLPEDPVGSLSQQGTELASAPTATPLVWSQM